MQCILDSNSDGLQEERLHTFFSWCLPLSTPCLSPSAIHLDPAHLVHHRSLHLVDPLAARTRRAQQQIPRAAACCHSRARHSDHRAVGQLVSLFCSVASASRQQPRRGTLAPQTPGEDLVERDPAAWGAVLGPFCEAQCPMCNANVIRRCRCRAALHRSSTRRAGGACSDHKQPFATAHAQAFKPPH